MKLITTPNLPSPNDAYARLIAAHDALSDAESPARNARLVLILMNDIWDAGVLAEAFLPARDPRAG